MVVPSAEQITEILNSYTSKPNGIPGIAFKVMHRDGSVLYDGISGVKGIQHKEPLTDDSMYFIASATKLITAVAAMQLVEQGKIHIDDPIENYIPEFGSLKVLEGFDKDNVPILKAPKTKATVRHCLAHVDGTSCDLFNPLLDQYIKALNLPSIVVPVREGLKTALGFEPGTKWEYGNGLDWVGLVIEAVTGQRLGDYLQQHIFDPLGIHSTTFEPTEKMASRMVYSHGRAPDRTVVEKSLPIMTQKVEYHAGGRGLRSTPSDYITLLHALLNDGVGLTGNRILKKETVDLLFADQTTPLGISLKGAGLYATVPAFVVSKELSPGLAKSWCFAGLRVEEQCSITRRSAGSIWGSGIANTHWWVDRSKGVTGVFFSQLLPLSDGDVEECWQKCERKIYEALQ